MSENVQLAIIAAIPSIIAAVATILNGRRLKRTSERTKRIEAGVHKHNLAHDRNGSN